MARARAMQLRDWLDQARLQGEAGQVSAAAAAALVLDPIQAGADGEA